MDLNEIIHQLKNDLTAMYCFCVALMMTEYMFLL